ncbi:SDR family NAD(P)-dependent oxidoreductase [Spirosoma flavum]|uniref:SDR family NAD(P)-dependent oxidoreductase n=1 Tax=Spirosoma flavum TaxID=2048557 RepID=A0ABW6AMF9_9BACT
MGSSYFSNSVVIVTGAASGIGRELALQTADRGASIIAADIESRGLEETRQLVEQQRGIIQSYVLDIANKEAIQQFAGQVMPTLKGRKLILINNAGAALLSGTFDQTDLEDMEWLFTINFWGAVRLTKAFYPYFLTHNKGHIVNVSSVFGLAGFPHQSAYSPAKFALRGFTETIRCELIGTGVITTCVHPGGIKTNIAKNSRVASNMTSAHLQAIEQFDQVAKTLPQEAARQLIRAIEKKKQRVLIGADAQLLDLLVRLFPVGYSRIIKKQTDKAFISLTN